MLEQLYQGLYADGFFTGTFQDFQGKFEDEEFRKKLHAGIVGDGDFTGDLNQFEQTFLGKTKGPTVDPTVGQESMGLQLGGGLSEQQEKNAETAFYDYKKNTKAYQRPILDWFKLITDDSELPEVEETDRQKGSYFAAQKHLAPYMGYNNVLSNFFAEGISNMYRSGGIGQVQGEGTQPSWNVMSQGKDVTLEDAKAFHAVVSKGATKEQTDNVKKYQGRYEQVNEEHGGIMAFMVAAAENPMYLRDVSISSMASMATSLFTSEDVAKRATAGTALGAAVGTTIPIIGTGLGAVSGLMGSVSGSMDAGLSYQQFLMEQITEDGLDFTPENIQKTLQNDEVITYKDPNNVMGDITGTRAEILKKRAIRRGVAIGFTDMATGVLSGGLAKGTMIPGKKLMTTTQRGVLGTGAAVGGGLASEVMGQTFGSQEYDAGEILTEGFAEKGIAMTGVTVLPQLVKKKGKYSIKGEEMTESRFVKEVNNMDDVTLAQASIKVENDPVLDSKLGKRIDNAVRDSQVDAKVFGKEDRKELVKKQRELEKAEVDQKKDGTAYAVPGAKEKVEKIKTEIAAIIDKYAGVDGRKKDVRDRSKIKELVAKARERIQVEDYKEALKDTEAFLGEAGKQIDMNPYKAFNNTDSFAQGVVDYLMNLGEYTFDGKKFNIKGKSNEQIAEEVQRVVTSARKGAGAVNLGDTIYINRETAVKYRQLDVGSHEILHSVLRGALRNMELLDAKDNKKKEGSGTRVKDMITEFKQEIADNLGKKVLSDINKRLTKDYTVKGKLTIDLDTTDEWFTALSDVIQDKKNGITYNNSKSFFDNIKDKVANLFNTQTDYENLSIETGKDAFLFMKEYSKSVEKGKLSDRMVAFTKGEKIPPKDEEVKVAFSKNQTDAVNELAAMGWDNKSWKEQGADFTIKEMQSNKMLDGLILAQPHVGIDNDTFLSTTYAELLPHVRNYKPENKNPNGLFGWVNPQIGNKAKQAYNAITKNELKYTKEIGETTKEGEVKIQVAAETDTAMEALETEDLSPAARAKKKADKAKGKEKVESEFRREIGIETGGVLYNKVLDSARKALLRAYEAGTSVRNIQRKLRDEANVYLFGSVKNFLGTTNYVKNLKLFREPIVKAVFTADLVQLERNVPDNERILTTFVKKLTSKQEVEDAVNQKLLPPSALNIIDKGTAVSLYKKKTPTEKQFLDFFYVPLINPVTGSRSGLRGTRKDGLAKAMAGALSYDATMEVAQEQDIIEKRAAIAEINNAEILNDDIQTLAAAIQRDPNVKFSKRDVSILEDPKKKKIYNFGSKVARAYTVVEDIFYNNKLDYYQNLTPEQKAKHGGKKMVDIAIDQYLSRPFERLDGSRIVDIIRKTRKKGQKVSEAYEQYFITSANKAIKAVTGKKMKANVVVREGGIPDVHFHYNGTTIGLEIKMDSARGVSSTWKFTGTYTVNNPVETKAQESLIEQIKQAAKLSIFEGMDFAKGVTREQFDILKKHKHKFNKAADVTAEYLAWQYTNKAMPEHFINIGEAGTFYMLGNNDITNANVIEMANKLGIPKLEGSFKLYSRLNTTSDFRKSDNRKAVTIRSDVQIDTKSLENFPKGFSPVNLARSIDMNSFVQEMNQTLTNINQDKGNETVANISSFSKSSNNPTKGITVLDFDDTLATSKSMIKFTKPDGTKGKLNAEQYASTYEELSDLGYKWDFSEFSKVVGGKTAPLFNKAIKLQGKFGPENMFVLTARPPDAAQAIHAFLKANGLNIPLKNITGLANSTADSKALWIADKVGEGYNDFYFADDALQNVQAVKNMLDQMDVKSKVQQARVKFSKNMSTEFNKVLERTTGVDAKEIISGARAAKRGASKGKYKFFVPPSAEDFKGLLYYFVGKGKQGEKDMAFFKKVLTDPLNRAYTEFNAARQSIANDYRNLKKQMPDVKKKLLQKTPDGDFTYGDAVRVYLWNKAGFDIPGLNQKDIDNLVEMVTSDPQLMIFAYKLGKISKRTEGYTNPTEHWQVGDIRNDLADATGRVGRKEFFTEFIENAEQVFGKMVNGKLTGDNINKIEAIFGSNFREALEDNLHATYTGSSRPHGSNRMVNNFTNWINGSVGAVMFVNMRSALLQQMSTVNFINWGDNNVFKAAKAFANQKQYWKDFAMIFNSDKLKQRRSGLSMDINANELATYLGKSKSKPAALLSWLLQKGFLPTQISDSIAIANGGATFYRNRVNTYLKQGLKQKEAESKAFNDFSEIAEETQQSARPDMVSQQQRAPIGKWFLNFLNTPMQYSRIMKKAMLDLVNRRGDAKTHISRIVYYGAAQNLIFYTLQTGLFAAMFADDDDDEKSEKFFDTKAKMTANSIIDGLLKGLGFGGAAISTVKNMIVKFIEEDKKGYRGRPAEKVALEMVNLSPVVGIKVRKITSAVDRYTWDKKVIKHMETFDIDNPMWGVGTGIVEGATNLPLNRLYRKVQNLRAATDADREAWQRLALISGWSVWNIGEQNEEIAKIKEELKNRNKKKKSKKKKSTYKNPFKL